MKIDAHVHLVRGPSPDESIASIQSMLAACAFDKAVLLPDFVDPNNDDVAHAVRAFPGSFYGIFILDFNQPTGIVLDQFESCLSQGFSGIKLHPRFQDIRLDREAERMILAACVEKKLPVIIDGFMRLDNEGAEQMEFIRRAAGMLAPTKIVIAHFGAQRFQEVLQLAREHENIYMDLSSSLLFFLSTLPDMVERMCRSVKDAGAKRFLHGSDYPIFDIPTYANQAESFLRKAGLDDAELKKVFGETALSVFG